MKILTDPLAETEFEVAPGLIWKYPNRLLWLTTYDCPSKCSFCFRKTLNAARHQTSGLPVVTKLIKTHPKIGELIFSGGEPLMNIELIYQSILSLSQLKQMQIFRIHTRQPITFPETIDWQKLAKLPQQVEQPIFVAIHVNSPGELARPTVIQAIQQLRRAGFILLSQSVFLKGINDQVEILEQLFSQLVALGVKPYYIFHCDRMEHTKQQVVPLETEIAIMTELRKRVSGIAYPLHVIDTETGHGKIPVPTKFWRADLTGYSDFAGAWSEVSG